MAQRRSKAAQPSATSSTSVVTPPRSTAGRDGSRSSAKPLAAQSRILKLSLLIRVISITLLVLALHLQQAFDTSHELLSYSLDPHTAHGLSSGSFRWLLALVRWDTIYFVASAAPDSASAVHAGGYKWEQSLAFQPGIVGLLRATGYLAPSLCGGGWSPTGAILVTTLLANVAAALSPVLLYRLTWKVTRNARLAYTASMLSMVAPSAGTTLASPTPEAFFSMFSLIGLLSLENTGLGWAQAVTASFWFALATAFRSNGTLLVGYIAFKVIGEVKQGRVVSAVLKMVLSVGICVFPAVLFQVWAYSRFCLEGEGRPWCSETVPSVYAFVQSHYWSVGLLRYWEVAQLPNFALAAPVVAGIAYTAVVFYRRSSWSEVASSVLPPLMAGVEGEPFTLQTTPQATPYVVHAVVLGAILVFASHVQIALRFATPGGMPMVWWGAAFAVLHRPRWRRVVVGYLVVQWCVSIVLYAGFYPPA